jgi:hypothetical protein
VRESREEQRIAQRSQRPQRGDSGGGRKFRRGHLRVTCENHAKSKASHRGHRGHRGGIREVDENSVESTLGSRARITRRAKHRTEVTEATEGDRAVDESSAVHILGSRARNTRRGASHRGLRGHRGGVRIVDENFAVNILVSGARTRAKSWNLTPITFLTANHNPPN